MTTTKQPKPDLRPYYTLGLPLLGLMGVIALIGIVLAAVIHFLF